MSHIITNLQESAQCGHRGGDLALTHNLLVRCLVCLEDGLVHLGAKGKRYDANSTYSVLESFEDNAA